MSRTPMYDPLTSDARSSWLAGLTEACNKLCGVLDMKTATFENLDLPELYISENDRYRIYQAPLGNKLWLSNPAPVIKKNGSVIMPENDGFSIDYLGGSIAFEGTNRGTQFDVFTASATYIVDQSNKISEILGSIETISQEAGKNKGAFTNASDLNSAYPVGTPGDFAIISSENAIYVWDDTAKEWVNANAKVDLTQYFTKEEVQDMVDAKQDKIIEKDIPDGSSDSKQNYFYAGDKTWVDLLSKIRTCALSGLVTNDDSEVQEADSLLVAIGKLQAQISGFIHPIIGNSSPTISTEGVIGQDYINSSNGDKYRLVSISNSGTSGKIYTWTMYGKTTAISKKVSINRLSWANNNVIVTDSLILSGSEYGYLVGPTDVSREEYQNCGIYATQVISNSKIVFRCETVPESNITVNICRLNGENIGGVVYNTGSSGGSSKNVVTVQGGGHMTMEEVFGEPPYTIEFTSEDPSDWTALDIKYNNTESGLDADNVQAAIDEVSETVSNKQPKLRGSAGQVVGFGADGAARAVAGWSNPNLLDNWYFADPVNQRGQEEYTATGYTIDRWRIAQGIKAAVRITDSGLEIKRTSDTRAIFQQVLTIDDREFVQSFAGREVTLSALFGQELRSVTMTIPTSNDENWYPAGTSGSKVNSMYVRLSINSNTTTGYFDLNFDIYVSAEGAGGGLITAVKLELGSQQTLARQDADGNWVLNDPPPDKVLELLKCQRYQVCVRAKQAYSMFGVAYGFTESIVVAFVPVPCNLRANPALATNGEFQLYNLQGSNVAISNISIDQWSTNGVRLLVEVASPVLTSGAIYQIRAKNNSDAYILFDANL